MNLKKNESNEDWRLDDYVFEFSTMLKLYSLEMIESRRNFLVSEKQVVRFTATVSVSLDARA